MQDACSIPALSQLRTHSGGRVSRGRRGSVLFALMVVNLVIASRSEASSAKDGKNYYVSTSGSDSNDGSSAHPWKTINHASSLVTAGATVHVAPGTYTVSVAGGTDSAIVSNASGTASARIRFVSDSKWGAKIVTSGSNNSWRVNGNYVDVEGFDVSGNGYYGLRMFGSYQRAIGNHVHNILAGAPACGSYGGAGIQNGNYSANDNDIIGNVVHDIGVPGACNKVHGIYLANLRGHTWNNISYHNSAWGITSWHAATHLVIANNLVFGNGGSSGTSYVGGGILIGDGDSPGGVINDYTVVANNIIYKNGGIGMREYCYSGQTCIGSHNQYTNNLVYLNAGPSTSLLFGHTLTNTIAADPQFVNFQANGSGDYHLKSTSPAIDKGGSLDAPQNDFDGGARPVGVTWDLGAYESGTTALAWPW